MNCSGGTPNNTTGTALQGGKSSLNRTQYNTFGTTRKWDVFSGTPDWTSGIMIARRMNCLSMSLSDISGTAFNPIQRNALENVICEMAAILFPPTGTFYNNINVTSAITRQSSWWRHQMEEFSALLALCAGNSPVPVNSPHKGQWREALMFSLICACINGWANNREAGDFRRHHSHYGVPVMVHIITSTRALPEWHILRT